MTIYTVATPTTVLHIITMTPLKNASHDTSGWNTIPSSDKQMDAGKNQYLKTDPNRHEVLLAIMGGSGTGKSTFTNIASRSQLPVGDGLESCTKDIQLSQPFDLDGYRVTLIDTPGFDDTYTSDADILKSIANFFAAIYKDKIPLNGVIYLHRISDIRMSGISRRNFTLFQKFCGVAALENVVIATTRWDQVNPEVGAAREEELKTKPNFFKLVLNAGAQMKRYDGSCGSAETILRCLMGKPPRRLLIQTEMVDEGKLVQDTVAGLELQKEILKQAEKHQDEMRTLVEEMEEATKNQDEEARMALIEECQALRDRTLLLQQGARTLSGVRNPDDGFGAVMGTLRSASGGTFMSTAQNISTSTTSILRPPFTVVNNSPDVRKSEKLEKLPEKNWHNQVNHRLERLERELVTTRRTITPTGRADSIYIPILTQIVTAATRFLSSVGVTAV